MKTIDSDCKNKFKWAWLERRVDLEIGKKKVTICLAVSECYQSLTAHQHQKGHTVPKQVITIATSIQVTTVYALHCVRAFAIRPICLADSIRKVDICGKALCIECKELINYASRGVRSLEEHLKTRKYVSRVETKLTIRYLQSKNPKNLQLLEYRHILLFQEMFLDIQLFGH